MVCAFKLTAKSGHFGSFYPIVALFGRFRNFLKNAKTTERINDFIPTLLTRTHTEHHEKEYMDRESAKADLLPFCTLFIVLFTQNLKIKKTISIKRQNTAFQFFFRARYTDSSNVSGYLPERMRTVVLRYFEVNVVEVIPARSRKY